jgi:ketosteroid isomerase-like protein
MSSRVPRFLIAVTAALLAVRPARAQAPADPEFRAFLVEFEDATSRFLNGDSSKWKQLLSSRDDATVLGAWGGFDKGPAQVRPRYEWSASRLTDIGSRIRVEYLASGVSGDLAFTVAIERGEIRRPDLDKPATVEMRVTDVFAKEGGKWKLLHRHADTITSSLAPPLGAAPAIAAPAAPAPAPGRGPAAPGALPVLKYDPPANFYRSASTPPEAYSSNEVNANVQIYPFRPCGADIVDQFQKTLLKDWIDPLYKEEQLSQPPTFARQTMAGAQAVVSAHLVSAPVGLPMERTRVLIVANGAAALVDLYANSAYSWQKAGPAIQAMMASMRVEAAPPEPPPLTGPAAVAARGLAGLYMGQKGHYVVDLNGAVGSGHWLTQPHFYLFSATGRVYRTFDPTIPADASKFDFDAALRTDPESSGRFTVQGDQLVLRMSGPKAEVITTALPKGNSVVIDKVMYLRQ